MSKMEQERVNKLEKRIIDLQTRLDRVCRVIDSNADVLRSTALGMNLCCKKLGITGKEVLHALEESYKQSLAGKPADSGQSVVDNDSGERRQSLFTVSDAGVAARSVDGQEEVPPESKDVNSDASDGTPEGQRTGS